MVDVLGDTVYTCKRGIGHGAVVTKIPILTKRLSNIKTH